MVYPIVKYGDPVLEREAEDVTEFGTPDLDQLIEDMFESMYAAKGEFFEMMGEDLLARAFLHETEHLYGRLYITHISALKRDLMKRKIKKLQRADEWG